MATSAGPLKVGLSIAVNQDAAIAASGITGVRAVDGRAISRAVLNDINGRGGVWGRKLEPVYYERDANSVDQAGVEEAQCAAFTEDARVFAAAAQGTIIEDCLQSAGVVNLITYSNHTRAGFRRNPLLFLTNSIALDRLGAALPRELQSAGYFRGSAAPPRVGVFSLDSASWREATEQALLPALKAVGHPAVEVAYTRPLDSMGATGEGSAQTQNAVLRFMAARVTHVVFFDILSSYLFVNAAAAQQYEPRYSFTSNDDPALLAANVPASQLDDSVFVGWRPLQDVEERYWDAAARAPSTRCRATMRAAGIPLSQTAASTCDILYFLEAALLAGGPRVSTDSFLAGVAALGDRFKPAASYATVFTADRHDGVEYSRLGSFVPSCACFRYTTGLRRIPV